MATPNQLAHLPIDATHVLPRLHRGRRQRRNGFLGKEGGRKRVYVGKEWKGRREKEGKGKKRIPSSLSTHSTKEEEEEEEGYR